MKLLFDEGLSPRLIHLLDDLFPGSESALRNGLARQGDIKILEYTIAREFVLVTTDADFEKLVGRYYAARVVVLHSCNYPTAIAAGVLRREAIRIGNSFRSRQQVLILER